MIEHQVAWLTGLSGAGKTTISLKVTNFLEAQGFRVLILDGDVVRAQRNITLGYSPSDIRKNNRLIVELCLESLTEYDVILVPVISPFVDSRAHAKRILGSALSEVYVSVSLTEAAKRDPKGLYRDHYSGKLQGLVGVSEEVPYERPANPDLILDTEVSDAETCSLILFDYLIDRIQQPSE